MEWSAVGTNVPFDLSFNGQTYSSGTVTQIKTGEEWAFLFTIQGDAGTADLTAGPLNPGYTCQAYNPFGGP